MHDSYQKYRSKVGEVAKNLHLAYRKDFPTMNKAFLYMAEAYLENPLEGKDLNGKFQQRIWQTFGAEGFEKLKAF